MQQNEPYIMFYAEINVTDSAGGIGTGLRQMSCPKHASEMPKMCPGMRKAIYLKVMISTS